jgi:hypothetical protein
VRLRSSSGQHGDVGSVSAPGGGQAVGANYGTVQQVYFHGPFGRLRDVTIPLDPLPGDLRLRNPANPDDPIGLFTGRRWLLDRIDRFIGRCVTRGQGGYLLVEAEAGMGEVGAGGLPGVHQGLANACHPAGGGRPGGDPDEPGRSGLSRSPTPTGSPLGGSVRVGDVHGRNGAGDSG